MELFPLTGGQGSEATAPCPPSALIFRKSPGMTRYRPAQSDRGTSFTLSSVATFGADAPFCSSTIFISLSMCALISSDYSRASPRRVLSSTISRPRCKRSSLRAPSSAIPFSPCTRSSSCLTLSLSISSSRFCRSSINFRNMSCNAWPCSHFSWLEWSTGTGCHTPSLSVLSQKNYLTITLSHRLPPNVIDPSSLLAHRRCGAVITAA